MTSVPPSSTTPTPQLFSLAGKTTAVTGGGRGLGITFAQAIVEAGGHVACLDILVSPSQTEWERLTTLAKSHNLTATYHHCDVTEETSASALLETIATDAEAKGAPFWGIVACAGIQQKVPALEYPVADFEHILRVNVTGTFVTCKAAANVLVKRKSKGSIVMISSMSGNIANRGLTCTAYNTSKSAVQQMCRSMAQEWGQYGIRINTLSPGYIRTNMTDELLQAEPNLEKTWMAGALLQRLGVPEDFKAPLVFLLAEGSSFTTGANFRIDGGHCASA
ncbi:short chain dehydrogenase [Zalerion maritima]|uniref:Short chain dehydrogenase n=1 Tax=Zalerion maritima TaxID=339359 RepID=A0AAD5RLA8_9PEZI|nr:short chain dehydrogenase [Zalerion maritima]